MPTKDIGSGPDASPDTATNTTQPGKQPGVQDEFITLPDGRCVQLRSIIISILDRVTDLENDCLNVSSEVNQIKLDHVSVAKDVAQMMIGGWDSEKGPFEMPETLNEYHLAFNRLIGIKKRKDQERRSKTNNKMDDTLDGTSVKDGPAGVQSSSQAVIVDRSASLSAQPRTNITATESVKAGPSTVKTCAQSLAEPISSLPPHLRRKKNGTTNGEASASTSSVPETTTSVPPHLRRKRNGTTNDNVSTTHSVTDRANSTIVTDGIVELSHAQLQTTPRVEPTPPASPSTTTVRQDTAIPFMETPSITQPSSQSDKPWVPLVVANFPSLPDSILSQIPPASTMTTFSYDFLLNELGGALHSPGLMFIAPPSLSPILTNRTYYTLNATVEPYLPSSPGQHGAKLTAFFNSNPEDDYDSVPVGCSFVSVPLFVCNSAFGGDKKGIAGSRYVYFGHYTQTRWSDKLDYDRMEQQVPQNVKQYWAEELAAAGRAKWVTEAMKTHFFPRPEYEGALPRTGANGEDNAEKVQKDMQKYVKVLGAWEKEANVKVGLIGRQDVLRAFEGADADEVPALRLWWEYLQCVAWEPKFYGGLVELQGRNQSYDEKK